MELIEREEFLHSLKSRLEDVKDSEGHCVVITGEAGIGKTSLIKAFCIDNKRNYKIYRGTCDALFTPRPLGPLYEILFQMKEITGENVLRAHDRGELFSAFLNELASQKATTIIIVEDIHWADEATLDFIKFFARRITQFNCLLILTYRDNEVHAKHPVTDVLGQIAPDSFSRIKLPPLSRQAVENLSAQKGYSGEDVYKVSGGNPFYVTEILASYSPGVPDKIKDSMISVYNRLDDGARQVCQILSVLPTGFETKYLERAQPLYANAIHHCIDFGILVVKDGLIFFKHELYRRTIESSLSPFLRLTLNKKILDLFLESFEQSGDLERIVHHAKNANANDLVVKYAPLAADRAALLGAHTEAAKLYRSAIEYSKGNDISFMVWLYESYSFECYLINQMKDAIIYREKALRIWKEKNNIENIGNCNRFLSRLWWCDGNLKKAENYGMEAIKVFDNEPASKAKAMAFSNMAHLKMMANEADDCMFWGEKAITMAKELGDEETLCHALASIGQVQARTQAPKKNDTSLLQQSLDIALRNNYDEQAMRAYSILARNVVWMKDYEFAEKIVEEGLRHCERVGIHLGTPYILSTKAWLYLDTGHWDDALRIANSLVANTDQLALAKSIAVVVIAKIKIRRGHKDIRPLLIEAKSNAFETNEAQAIIPLLSALLEYEWLTGERFIDETDLDYAVKGSANRIRIYDNSEFVFWLMKTRNMRIDLGDFFEGYKITTEATALRAAQLWKHLGCPYERALALFEGAEGDKRVAIEIVHNLGADAVYEKMKFEMRSFGIKNIPLGLRKSTLSNPANLTSRELEVLQLLKEGLQNREIGSRLFISAKTVSHHIASIFFKLDVNSRGKAVQQAIHLSIIK